MRRAILAYHDKQMLLDGAVVELKIWQVPEPVRGSTHRLKYRLYYGRDGVRIVGYDNEAGKGDHRHIDGREESYRFASMKQLMTDFLADVRRARGE